MTKSQQPQPSFDNPPVIETFLGVQFARISDFSSAHYGWYWKKFLADFCSVPRDEIFLGDQFEKFGEDKRWKFPVPLIQIA